MKNDFISKRGCVVLLMEICHTHSLWKTPTWDIARIDLKFVHHPIGNLRVGNWNDWLNIWQMACSVAMLESESCKFNFWVIQRRILICELLDLLVVPKIICMDHIYNSYIVQMLTRLFRAALNVENNQDWKKVGVENFSDMLVTSLTKHSLFRVIHMWDL